MEDRIYALEQKACVSFDAQGNPTGLTAEETAELAHLTATAREVAYQQGGVYGWDV